MAVYAKDSETLKFYEKNGWDISPFTKNLLEGGFHSMKDFDIALHEIAWHTGYDYEFLNGIFNEHVEEGCFSYIDILIHISEVSVEKDW